MKNLIAFKILVLILITNAKSQTVDTAFISDCKILQDKGQLEEARDCYLEHDTNVYAIYGAAVVSKQLNDLKTLKKLTKKLTSKKVRTPISFELCAELYADDSSKYIQIINKGLDVYAHDTLLLTHKTNYYLNNGDFEMAITYIDELIFHKKDDNKSLFFAKAYAYDIMGDFDNALSNYKKAIEIDSAYFDAYYNLGVAYYNQAVNIYELANNEMKEQAYLRLKLKAEDELAKALPYFEKANQINPNNIDLLNTLQTVYYRLGLDEYKEIKKQIEALEKD